MRLSSRLAVPRAVPSAPANAEDFPDHRSLSASNPHASASHADLPPKPSHAEATIPLQHKTVPPPVHKQTSLPSLSSGPNLVNTFAFMHPRIPRQATAPSSAPSPLPPPVSPPPPIDLPPPVEPPPTQPPPVKPPPVKPPPFKPPPVKPPPVKSPPIKPPPVKPPPAPPPPVFQPWPINGQGVFNVLQFGARADGRTDNTDAFRRALQTACAWGEARSAYARVVVPAGGLFQIFPVDLEGPCGAGLEVQAGVRVGVGEAERAGLFVGGKRVSMGKAGSERVWRVGVGGSLSGVLRRLETRFAFYWAPRNSSHLSPQQINGGIVGPANVTSYPKPRKSNAWALLFFREVPNLAVTGGGWMDGRGAGFWARGKGSKRPALLFLMHCDNATVQGVGNPGKAHLKVYGNNGLLIERITTRSPVNSPNTDSIQLTKIENGIIRNSHLQGGDDNVAINDGCHNLLIENLVCINGHGVSIGSLGEDQETACVSDVLVRNVSFTGSNNALRIKTYQGGKGLVSNVTFKDIRMTDVTWPIIINQVCSVVQCGAV
ncbi:unnamed protein product [Closterium sp. NIES-53]